MSHNFEEHDFMVTQTTYTPDEIESMIQAFSHLAEEAKPVSNVSIVVGYPNQVGDAGRYTLRDQRDYFSKFDGGASRTFGMALSNVVAGDLLNYTEHCNEVFDNHYQVFFDENTARMDDYNAERREFNRRIFDIYRFAKTSVGVLGTDLPFTKVKQLTHNQSFDTGMFLLR